MTTDQGQRSRSQGHVMYQQQSCYIYATDGRINFKLGGNFHREVCNTWHTFYVSRSTRPEVKIWQTFSFC